MAGFRDLQLWLKSFLFPGQAEGNRRPDGGTSCYRPVQRKNPEDHQQITREDGAAQAVPQTPVAHTGFTDMNPPATGMYSQPGISGDPYGYGAAQQAQQEYRAGYAAGRETPPSGNNISYMPGAFAPGSGNSYTHVEHVMAVTSLSACYEAIECMKNGETVIATMDTIANESESIRCQDMLAGAAFTLGCTVRMLQAGEVILIASAGVKVLPEQQARSWYAPAPAPVGSAGPAEDRQRARRVSQNAVGWKNAFSEENREYNPYTGSMPAAAGDYGSYGGYGSGRPRENTAYAPGYGDGTYGSQGGYFRGNDQQGYSRTGYMNAPAYGGYGESGGNAGYGENGYGQTGYMNGSMNQNGYGQTGYRNGSMNQNGYGQAAPAPQAGYGF